MIGSSIYLRDRAAFTGGTPQAVFEELWQRDRKARLRNRAILAGLTILLCGALANAVFGVVAGAVVAALDAFYHWHGYHSSHVWRHGLRGDLSMNRLLRFTLERRGYRVLYGRTIPGHGTVDQLVVGPGGLWLIHNEAWHPEAEISAHGGRLFIDGRTQTRMVTELTEAAGAAGPLISDRGGLLVKVTPALAVHGGTLVKRAPFTADRIVFATPWRLLRWISQHPSANYSAEDVETITRAAIHALPIGGHTMDAAA
jgi:hypothetical protein